MAVLVALTPRRARSSLIVGLRSLAAETVMWDRDTPRICPGGLSLYPIRGTLSLTTEVSVNKSAMIRARVDPALKDEVESVFEQLGLSATQAITLFYQQVRLNRGLPFDVRVPNAVTQRTFTETDTGQNIVRCENAEDMFVRLGI